MQQRRTNYSRKTAEAEMPRQLDLLGEDDETEFWENESFLGLEIGGPFQGRYHGGSRSRNVFVSYATGNVLHWHLEPIGNAETPERLFRSMRTHHRSQGDFRAVAIAGGMICLDEMCFQWGYLRETQITELIVHSFSKPFYGIRAWEPYFNRTLVTIPALGRTLGTIRELLSRTGRSGGPT